MSEKNFIKMKNIAVAAAAVIMAVSVSGCAGKETPDSAQTKEETTTTVTTTAAPETTEATETQAETETTTTTQKSETATEAPKDEKKTETTSVIKGTLSDDFDAQLDSMIASAEAEIPDIDIKLSSKSDTKSKTSDDSKAATTTKAETTTTTAKVEEAAPASDLKNEHQLTFGDVTYDNTTFTSEGVTVPSGWTLGKSTSGKQYENDSYPGCYLVEGYSKGVSFGIGEAKYDGKTSYPPLKLYKGLTWGASADDIKAAYGTPVKEGHSEQYGTQMTNLFYSSPDGSLIIYEVSSDWGLIVINCCGK